MRPHSSSGQIRDRIRRLGDTEHLGLVHLQIPEINTTAAVLRLGWGFSITEFLIAPVFVPESSLDRICSLGALVNCMVSTCDHLLDTGTCVEDVLPQDQLTTGGNGSPIMKMLREYFDRLRPLVSEGELLRFVRRLIGSMFEAEIQTVTYPTPLPHRFWLRKCCLPLVLMAVPAYFGWLPGASFSWRAYLNWLFRVGRFLGALDDALDLEEDIHREHPNYFSNRSASYCLALLPRIARLGSGILSWWDTHVPPSRRPNSREAFLHTIWGW